MRQPKQKLSANDNSPLRQKPNSFGMNRIRYANPSLPTESLIAEYKNRSAMGWIAPITGILIAVYAVWQKTGLDTLVWPAILMAVILTWTCAKAESHSRLRNISALVLIGAVTVGLSGLLSFNGFSLMGVELALLISLVSLFVGWTLKSPPAVMLSAITTLVYLISLFPQLGVFTGITDGVSKLGIGLVPVLLIFQAAMAQRLKSPFITVAIILASYIWVMTLSKDIPITAIAGIGFALASAHYCLGMAWASQDIYGARLHIIVGAVLALTSAFYVQSIWMAVDTGQAVPFWPPSLVWWTVLACAMLAIFISSLMRYKSSQISLIGIFIISLAALVLPLATAKPDLIHTAFENIPGLNANPGLGLIIGATLIAFGLFWIVKGLKEGFLLEILIGMAIIGVQTLLLYKPDSLNMDFGVVFIVALICALCVGGLITGSTSDHNMRMPQHA